MNRFVAICGFSILIGPQAVAAQQVQGLTAGVRIRMTGERVTDAGVRRFAESGSFMSADSHYLILRTDSPPRSIDTVFLEGVHRLELFNGLRSRKDMTIAGATVGTIAGTAMWLFARSVIRPTVVQDGRNPNTSISSPVPPVVHQLRNAIPIVAGAGALAGVLVGQEKWIVVSLPLASPSGESPNTPPFRIGAPPSTKR
jgi:hypothetical protein